MFYIQKYGARTIPQRLIPRRARVRIHHTQLRVPFLFPAVWKGVWDADDAPADTSRSMGCPFTFYLVLHATRRNKIFQALRRMDYFSRPD